jgi:hypothetical protein
LKNFTLKQFINEAYIYLGRKVLCLLRSQKKGKGGSFYGFAEKRTTFPPFLRAKQAREANNGF